MGPFVEPFVTSYDDGDQPRKGRPTVRLIDQNRQPKSAVLHPVADDWDPGKTLKVEVSKHPAPHSTLCDLGLAASVSGLYNFPLTLLVPDQRTRLDRR